MNARITGSTECDMTTRVERWIEQRTGGRIHHLQVEITGGRVIVRGSAGSHYVRQLALAAALEATEGADGRAHEVELDVRVGTSGMH